MKRIISTAIAVVVITIGLASPAHAAAPTHANLPACSATGVSKTKPTTADRAPLRASQPSCRSVIHFRVPNPAAQDGKLLSADVVPAIASCEEVVNVYSDYVSIWTTGHFDCGGYVPYYMAIEVGLVNDDPDLPNVDVGKEAYGVDHIDLAAPPFPVFCGVVYAGAVRGALKISSTDPGTVFPYVFTEEFELC